MSLIGSFDSNIYPPFEIEDLIKNVDKNSGSETSFEEYFKSSYSYEVDKKDSVESALKTVNGYCKVRGGTDREVTYWDGQVREMMEIVRRIRETLPVRTKVDNVFNLCEEEMEDTKLPQSEEDLKASFAEIAKMDAVLKLKQAEEKKAKFDTIQAEEESRDILIKMPCFERSTGIRNNFEEFMKLLNDVESTESSSLALPPLERTVREEQKEDKKKKEEKRVNPDSQQQKTTSKFVVRNIKLAKCGRGTLSVTEEEKSRLEELLGNDEKSANGVKESEESEDSEESREPSTEETEDSNIPEEECYGIDYEIQSVLSQIDQQLEVLRNSRGSPLSNITFLEKNKSEEKISDEDEKQNANKRKKREKTPERLEKINKQLHMMNTVSKEEIKPLSEKEIASLVKQSKRSLSDWKKFAEKPEEFRLLSTKASQDVISELVSNAKTLMPKFKYRFGKS